MEKISVSEGTLRFLFDSLLSRYVMMMTGGKYDEVARCMGAPREISCDYDAKPSIIDPEADWYIKYSEFIGFWKLFYSIPDAKERAEIEADFKMRCAMRADMAASTGKAGAHKKGKD